MNTEKVIENLNYLIHQCVDYGGAPYQNKSTEELMTSIQLILNSLGVNHYCVQFVDNKYPYILLPGQKEIKEIESFCF